MTPGQPPRARCQPSTSPQLRARALGYASSRASASQSFQKANTTPVLNGSGPTPHQAPCFRPFCSTYTKARRTCVTDPNPTT